MIRLETLEKKDFISIVKWNENKSSDFLLQWAGAKYNYPLTIEQIQEFFCSEVEADNQGVFVYKIILEKTSEIIGTIELRITDKEKRIGRICRFLIGNEGIRGKGMGAAALKEALRIGFYELDLEKITLAVFDFNVNAIKCYKGIGFINEKFIKDARKAENGYWNLYEMFITKGKSNITR
jgi:RimJ/RimL family protein N-acetyltransferase